MGYRTPDLEGYEVTRDGRVISYKRKTPKELATSICAGGYKRLLINGSNWRVHQLVAYVHLPNPEGKPQVNHINGIKTDNRVENLEWVTPSENTQHSWDNGLQTFTEKGKTFNALGRKLSREDAQIIRQRYVARCRVNGIRALAREYGVSKQVIQKIVHRETYLE